MLKSLLIGLDGSDDSSSVVELGLRWAERFGALAVGVGIVDEPGILTSAAAMLGGGHHWHVPVPTPLVSERRRQVEESLQQFDRRCGEAGVTCRTLVSTGSPFAQILAEAQCHDVILLGQRTHFDYGWEDRPDETLVKVLRDSPRPVVAVPKKLGAGEAVVVAYDGSLQAARALAAFEASGLGRDRGVHVVSVGPDEQEAARLAGRAIAFLHSHEVEAKAHPVNTAVPAADVILRKVHYFDAGLLVMGAYGQTVLREFFLGSVTRALLETSPVPIFCFH